MMERLLIAFLIHVSVWGADKIGPIVVAADGKQYGLVKPEKQLSNGAIEIAEYVLVGDNSGVRYAMHLARVGGKPSFWKINNIHVNEILLSSIGLQKPSPSVNPI
jgi:hypothetical protein